MPRFRGLVRLVRSVAKLETRKGTYTLNPYLADAPIPKAGMHEIGRELFGYLDGHEVFVAGSLKDDVIYNAHLETSPLPVQDVRLEPESNDPFAQQLQQIFQKNTREIAAKLNDLGVRTASALYHRIRNNHQEVSIFAKYLKVTKERIEEFLSVMRDDPTSQALVSSSPRFPVKRGVNLALLSQMKGVPVTKKPPTAPPKFPASGQTSHLPSKVAVNVTPIKNQGMRGTCVAHASVACLEAEFEKHSTTAKGNLDLSEQYLYWACKSIDGSPRSEGTFIKFAADILLTGLPGKKVSGGVCSEKQWPYNRYPVAGNESQGPPPAIALKGIKKKKFSIQKSVRVRHNSIRAIKERLADGHCVGISVYTYHFWTDDYAWREGVISLPL